jgi:phage tail-like protein
MRGTALGLATPYPLGELLPAVYQEDPFAMRWMAALDEVLAPVVCSLDCLEAYFDPSLTPLDFLHWLSGWVGVVAREGQSAEQARAAVAHAVELYRIRGTVAGLRAYLEVLTGAQVAIADNGGVTWSTVPGAGLPGEDTPRLAVRISGDLAATLNRDMLDTLISAAKPAHVIHRLEVTTS